jgi:hypothetical protein
LASQPEKIHFCIIVLCWFAIIPSNFWSSNTFVMYSDKREFVGVMYIQLLAGGCRVRNGIGLS